MSLACEQALIFGREKRTARASSEAARPLLSRLLSRAFRASTFHDIPQAPVVRKLDSAIHRINHYPVDKYKGNRLHNLLDRDLSAG